MFKTLLKKQFLEVLASLSRSSKSKKTGKPQNTNILLIALVYLLIFAIVGANLYFVLARPICEPLHAVSIDWLYFAIAGLSATLFGIVGSIFTAYQTIYVAKDNEFLLSLPIKPSMILIVRVLIVYLMGLFNVLMVMIPYLIAYYIKCSPDTLSVVLSALSPLFIALVVFAFSSLLGWIVSLVVKYMKNTSFFTVILSLLFLFAYYFFIGQSNAIIRKIVTDPYGISLAIKGKAYPVYAMGMGAAGNIKEFLIFAAISICLFAAVFILILSGFKKTLMGSSYTRAPQNSKYSSRTIKTCSFKGALLKKEFLRYTSSANYMLNANIGLVFMLAAAVVGFVYRNEIQDILKTMPFGKDFLALLVCALICLLVSYNVTTASSVSIDGKTFWVEQSLPIAPIDILNAKLKLHIYLVLPALALLLASVLLVFKFDLITSLVICAASLACLLLCALLGLVLNLLFPNLDWNNETVPVKQSVPVFICVFLGMILVGVFGFIYYLLRKLITPFAYLSVLTALLIVIDIILYGWIKKKGAEIYAQIS